MLSRVLGNSSILDVGATVGDLAKTNQLYGVGCRFGIARAHTWRWYNSASFDGATPNVFWRFRIAVVALGAGASPFPAITPLLKADLKIAGISGLPVPLFTARAIAPGGRPGATIGSPS